MNNENMTIKIITEEAKEIEASVISIFRIKETNNEYAIYTFNEEDAQGLVKIYASRLVLQDGTYTFESIADANEWNKIKDVMKDTAKENSAYIANGDIVLISAKSIKRKMNEPISVKLSETKAAKIGPNYKTGISNNYLNNVVDEVPSNGNVIAEQPVQTPVTSPTPEVVNTDTVSADVNKVVTPEIVTPKIEEPVNMPEIEKPVEIPKPVSNVTVESPSPVIPDVPKAEPKFEMPITNEIPKEEPVIKEQKVELPEVPKFEAPKVEEPVKEEYSFEQSSIEPEPEKEQINVDSILNKASYYQNLEEPVKEEKENKENIIQTIGLEFMRKVSELAEYEKDLTKKNRELEARERVLTKIEKEIINKENRQKYILQASKDKEMELKKKDRELAEKEADLNRRILEFNKKISMFQQTFETISQVD